MIFDVELINLLLYCAQQLGIALGLGAQTIMLVAYVSAMRDGTIDDTEAQFLRATRSTLWVSLVLIVLSGVAITALHALAGQGATIMTSTYLFKSLLIAAVIVLTALLHVLPETFVEGLLGGTWYALFMVHILAPVTSWMNFLTLWAIWLVGFNLIWYVIVFSNRQRVHPPPIGKSSEAMILQKSKPPAPKPPRKPFFNFSFFAKAPVKPELFAATAPQPVPPPPPQPQQFQQIRLDPVPKTLPVAAPEALAPIEVKVPLPPPMPALQIKTDPAPVIIRVAPPIEKMPANRATDTPFLPQVPPLQPIPIIMPGASTTVAPVATPIPAAGIPKANGQPPVLQKPEELSQAAPTVAPEIKLGLNVMPKSPDQLKQ